MRFTFSPTFGRDANYLGHIRSRGRLAGSVRSAENGRDFVGRIGQFTATASTPEAAFREVAAQALGFATATALKEHNKRVRATRRAARTGSLQTLANALRRAASTGNNDEVFRMLGGRR